MQKKAEKFRSMIFDNFGVILGHFGPKNLQTRFFPKKVFSSILNLYAAATSSKKSEKFRALTFDNA